jgi:phosphoheptose isomerase
MKKRRFVLLDRDGTLNVKRHYLTDPDDLELLPNTIAGLRHLRELELGLVVITNQSAIGRGFMDMARLQAIHRRFEDLLAREGLALDGIYFCPHTPDDGCQCRKPQAGLALQAAREWRFDPAQSFVIGDGVCDDATTLLVRTGDGGQVAASGEAWPDFVVADLGEAARTIETILGVNAPQGSYRLCENAPIRLRRHLAGSVAAKQRCLERCQDDILAAAEIIADSLRQGGKLLLCGNGGSAADSQHIAGEFVNLLSQRTPRPALASLALTTDTSVMTAYANDFGFAGVFERQLEALARPGDVLMGLSTSGNSENVVRAMHAAHKLGVRTIALSGGPGGQLADVAEAAICVPSVNVQHIQEVHITVGHILCYLVEETLYGRELS